MRPIGAKAREAAFRQVMNYFRQNQDEMQRVVETEVDVSVEKDGYILTGKVDLLLGGDGKLEILDFKTSDRTDDPELIAAYERQLCTYAHILERRHGKRPERLLLYWTAEERKEDAVMEFPYRPELVDEAGRHFDEVVGRIQPPTSGSCASPSGRSARSATCGRSAPPRACSSVRREGVDGEFEITRTELVWPGKYDESGKRREVERVNLPFQVIERVNESRATREARKERGITLFDVWEGDTGETFEDGWRNKLIWGDNILVDVEPPRAVRRARSTSSTSTRRLPPAPTSHCKC